MYPDNQNFQSYKEWEQQVKSASKQLFPQLTHSVISVTAVQPNGRKSKESPADLVKITKKKKEGQKKEIEKGKNQFLIGYVGEREWVSRREEEEDSVVMGREEYGREEISVQYLAVNSTLCTFFYIFVVLLLKSDFSIQHWEFQKTCYQ